MSSARQYLLHRELKQDRTDLASSNLSENFCLNKASRINSASRRSKHVFWRDSFEFPLFTEPKWNKRDKQEKWNKVSSYSSVQKPAPLRAHSKQTTSTSFHSEQFPAYDCSKKGWNISQLHLLNFLFLDVQESINENLSPLSLVMSLHRGGSSNSSPLTKKNRTLPESPSATPPSHHLPFNRLSTPPFPSHPCFLSCLIPLFLRQMEPKPHSFGDLGAACAIQGSEDLLYWSMLFSYLYHPIDWFFIATEHSVATIQKSLLNGNSSKSITDYILHCLCFQMLY